MPMLFNCACNLAFGAAVAWALRRNPTFTRAFATWPLLLLALFEALLQTPVTAILVRFQPHWATSYMFDPQIFPHLEHWLTWLALLPVALNFGAALLGYGLIYWGITRDNPRLLRLPTIITLDAWAIVIGVSGRQLLHMGDYDTFWQGRAQALVLRPVGVIVLVSWALAVVGVLWMGRRYAKSSPDFLHFLKS